MWPRVGVCGSQGSLKARTLLHVVYCSCNGRGGEGGGGAAGDFSGRDATPHTGEVGRGRFGRGGGGSGVGPQHMGIKLISASRGRLGPKDLDQKWPNKIFPIVHFVFSLHSHFGLEVWGGVQGGGHPPPSSGVRPF